MITLLRACIRTKTPTMVLEGISTMKNPFRDQTFDVWHQHSEVYFSFSSCSLNPFAFPLYKSSGGWGGGSLCTDSIENRLHHPHHHQNRCEKQWNWKKHLCNPCENNLDRSQRHQFLRIMIFFFNCAANRFEWKFPTEFILFSVLKIFSNFFYLGKNNTILSVVKSLIDGCADITQYQTQYMDRGYNNKISTIPAAASQKVDMWKTYKHKCNRVQTDALLLYPPALSLSLCNLWV